ncbi:DUF6221 family protein [Streptomyces europaeiscabiei]|uniref:DUF6221 family protein n=1 Tax=Streptomyces europaeiscabiei TaxID=146819 RepID=A0ABU4NX73_9ACTN|nr:DUF6221 family protein [Streptomyces europaeiscabiei]MDX2766418.1 DUF6221 family protein [Streptomyces europaeiscabiei]MDX3549720.1 DUF6221 family protein [Streptomyces europaeiscabiei]MDX3558805.1 DUF6221 family protein [Streptomyces europaeiscabiei]MDX3707259.1 DUF6221 family protein [Streptomyces europaeiscabiei]
MDDLVQWLRAQLDEDERIAKAATPGPWRAHDTHLGQYGHAATVLSGEGNDTDLRAWLPSMSQEPWDEARNVWADAEHVAAHDPARVLREIDAKREIVEQHVPVGDGTVCLSYCHTRTPGEAQTWPCLTLRLLALPYADRPGYQDEWKPVKLYRAGTPGVIDYAEEAP